MSGSNETLGEWILDSIEENQVELPVFPVVASRLVDLLEQPDAQLAEVEAVISQDQTITSQVLSAANSALYAGAMPAENLSQALMRLGFREATGIGMAAACRALFDMQDRAEFEVFPHLWMSIWQDSLVCAYGARLIATDLELEDADQAFLGALLRDVGTLLVLKLVARGVVAGRLRSLPEEGELAEAVSNFHVPLGANYLRLSNLPAFVVAAAKHHHDLELGRSPEASRALHVVRLADSLCSAIGLGTFSCCDPRPLIEAGGAELEITAEQLEVFELQFRELTEQLRTLL